MKKLIMLETTDKNSPILQGVKVEGYSPRLIHISEADEEWLKFGTNINFYLIDTDAKIKEFDYDIEYCNVDKKWLNPDKVVNESWDRVSKANYCRNLGTNFKVISSSNKTLENVPQLSNQSIKLAIGYFNRTGKKEVEVGVEKELDCKKCRYDYECNHMQCSIPDYENSFGKVDITIPEKNKINLDDINQILHNNRSSIIGIESFKRIQKQFVDLFNGKYIPEEKMYSKEDIMKLKSLADAIINPACDILPETYNEEINNYYNWISKNLK